MTIPRRPEDSRASEEASPAPATPRAARSTRSARVVGYLCMGMAVFFVGLTLLMVYTGMKAGPPFPTGLVLFGFGMALVFLKTALDFLNTRPKP